jgi:hypothetical protein
MSVHEEELAGGLRTTGVKVLVEVLAELIIRKDFVLYELPRRKTIRETVASHWPDERVKFPRNGARKSSLPYRGVIPPGRRRQLSVVRVAITYDHHLKKGNFFPTGEGGTSSMKADAM